MGWGDERVETLKKLWLDGLSASQIAKQLGGVTRNAAVIRQGAPAGTFPAGRRQSHPSFARPLAPRPPRPNLGCQGRALGR